MPLRQDKSIGDGELTFTKASTNELRDNLIVLRDSALQQNEFQWAVLLSHIVVYMKTSIEIIWDDTEIFTMRGEK